MSKTTIGSEGLAIGWLKSGSPAQFSLFYDRYADSLFGVLCRLVKDPEHAADLLQESMLKAWTNATKYDASKGTLFTWLLNITRNQAIDFLRSKNFMKEGKTFSLPDSVNIEEDDYWKGHPYELPVENMMEWLSWLKEEQSIPIKMVYLEGYSQAEAAEILNIPLGTLKTRVRAGLRQIRNLVVTILAIIFIFYGIL